MGGSIRMSERWADTPSAARTASSVSLVRMTICSPPPPASSKAWATVSAHTASCSLAASQDSYPLITLEASRVAHEQEVA